MSDKPLRVSYGEFVYESVPDGLPYRMDGNGIMLWEWQSTAKTESSPTTEVTTL